MKVSFLFISIIALITSCYAVPEVKIGGTTLVGRDVTILKQDFFGGKGLCGWSTVDLLEVSLNLRDTIRRTSSWRFEVEATYLKEENRLWDFWCFKFRSSMSSTSMWFNCTQWSLISILWRILPFLLFQKIVWLSMFFDLRTFWKTWHCPLYVGSILNALSLTPFQLFWTWVPFEHLSTGCGSWLAI